MTNPSLDERVTELERQLGELRDAQDLLRNAETIFTETSMLMVKIQSTLMSAKPQGRIQ